jgi:hypothetical protein
MISIITVLCFDTTCKLLPPKLERNLLPPASFAPTQISSISSQKTVIAMLDIKFTQQYKLLYTEKAWSILICLRHQKVICVFKITDSCPTNLNTSRLINLHYSSKFLCSRNIMLDYSAYAKTAYLHRCGVKKIVKLELQHKPPRFKLQSWVFSLSVLLHYLSPRFTFSSFRIHAERPFQTLCLSTYMYFCTHTNPKLLNKISPDMIL